MNLLEDSGEGSMRMAIIDHEMLWRQFGAAIDMLRAALRDRPDEPEEEPQAERSSASGGASQAPRSFSR
jgi:hypothetical protein